MDVPLIGRGGVAWHARDVTDQRTRPPPPAAPTANVKGQSARQVITNASRGLAETLSSNLGPKGTLKMLVSGSGARARLGEASVRRGGGAGNPV